MGIDWRFTEHFASHYLALHSAVVRNDLVFYSVVLATHFA